MLETPNPENLVVGEQIAAATDNPALRQALNQLYGPRDYAMVAYKPALDILSQVGIAAGGTDDE